MAKKKSSSAADDLIKNLMDEVNEDSPEVPAEYPVGFDSLPETEDSPKNRYDGPSIKTGIYQRPEDIFQAPQPQESKSSAESVAAPPEPEAVSADPEEQDRTVPLPEEQIKNLPNFESQKHPTPSRTGALRHKTTISNTNDKVVIAGARPGSSGSVMTGVDASLMQAENLRMAQQRILELESEVDTLRRENEEISSAAEIVRERFEAQNSKLQEFERERRELVQQNQEELSIVKGQLQYKETEYNRALQKIEELEIRIKNDFKKIRVRERELENRLEIVRVEKQTLIRAKDDSILDLKRKVDQLRSEIDNYREKCLELNKVLEAHKEQFKRTVRALKLALTNLETKDEDAIPFKKAE